MNTISGTLCNIIGIENCQKIVELFAGPSTENENPVIKKNGIDH